METAYYTLAQACELLMTSESTIRRRIQDGTIPKSRISGTILIPRGFIDRERSGENYE